MSYLLDTCVISEFTRKTPSRRVVKWLDRLTEGDLYLSSITVGELARGIARLKAGTKKRSLDAWLHGELMPRFEGRLVAVDEVVAIEWGKVSGSAMSRGFQISMADGLIAATARLHSQILVTRNVADFAETGVSLLNPWEDV